MSVRQLLLAITTVSSLALAACGGSSSGYLKVDSPLVPFEPPDKEELLEDSDDEGDDSEAPTADDQSTTEDAQDATEDDDA